MKRCLSIMILVASAFCFSMASASDQVKGPEIELSFVNPTETEIRIHVREEVTKDPYTYETVLQIKLAPGESTVMPVSLTATDETKRLLLITAKGSKSMRREGV